MSDTSAFGTIPGYARMLDDISKLIAEVPPPPVLASCALFPSDHAWQFRHDGRDFICAGPEFWEAVPAKAPEVSDVFVLGGIRIVDIDHPAEFRTRNLVMTSMTLAIEAGARRDETGTGSVRRTPERAEGIAQPLSGASHEHR